MFASNFIDLDISSILAISHYWLFVGRCPGAAEHPVHKAAPQQRIIWPTCQQYRETSQTTSDTFSQSQHLLHIRHKSSFAFQLSFYLS